MWYCDLKFLVKFKIDALVWKIFFFFFRYSCCFGLKNYLCYFAWLIADPLLFKSSHRSCSIRKGVRNFSKFTGKRLCQSLFFNKVAGLHRCFPVQLLHHRAFPVDFAKFSRTAFFRSNQSPADILQNITEHFQWLPLCFAKTLQTMVHCLFY